MHSSWYRSLILPAASITIAAGGMSESNQRQRRCSTPQTRSAEGSPKPLHSPLLAATLITTTAATNSHGEVAKAGNVETPPTVRKDPRPIGGKLADSTFQLVNPTGGVQRREQKREGVEKSATNTWAAGCNPLGLCTTTGGSQVVPLDADDSEVEEEGGRAKTDDEQQQEAEEEVNRNCVLRSALAASSLEQKGTLSTNVSSTQLEELVMKPSADASKPLIILFGWAGCRDRYLAKYAAYYESKGYAVARFTVPISKVRSFSTYRRFALQIYEEILQAESNRPLFFHVFSMNGASLFTALWDLLEHLADGTDIKQRVRGLIFDSSPANVLPWQAANAVSFSMFPPQKFGAVPREACRVALAGVFSLHRAMVWLQSHFNPQSYEKHYAFFRLLKFPDLPRNQLFLYSSADDICVHDSIEAFQEKQRRSARVQSKNFGDSKHCEHFRTYTSAYIEECIEFTEKAMEEGGQTI